MDSDLQKMVEENNRLLREQIILTQENQRQIEKIHTFMRRLFYLKIAYWLIIALVTAGAFISLLPMAQETLELYQSVINPSGFRDTLQLFESKSAMQKAVN